MLKQTYVAVVPVLAMAMAVVVVVAVAVAVAAAAAVVQRAGSGSGSGSGSGPASQRAGEPGSGRAFFRSWIAAHLPRRSRALLREREGVDDG